MTREPRQRYLKVHCSEQDRWQNHGWNEWLHRLSMLYFCTNGYFFVICPRIQRLLPFYKHGHDQLIKLEVKYRCPAVYVPRVSSDC